MTRPSLQPGPFATLPRMLAPLALLLLPFLLAARLLTRLGLRDGDGYRLAIGFAAMALGAAVLQLVLLLLAGPVRLRGWA